MINYYSNSNKSSHPILSSLSHHKLLHPPNNHVPEHCYIYQMRLCTRISIVPLLWNIRFNSIPNPITSKRVSHTQFLEQLVFHWPWIPLILSSVGYVYCLGCSCNPDLEQTPDYVLYHCSFTTSREMKSKSSFSKVQWEH